MAIDRHRATAKSVTGMWAGPSMNSSDSVRNEARGMLPGGIPVLPSFLQHHRRNNDNSDRNKVHVLEETAVRTGKRQKGVDILKRSPHNCFGLKLMPTKLKVYTNEDDALLFWSIAKPIKDCRGFAIERKITRHGDAAETS